MAIFKSSARSVDMLGRQQIAGIPTAISEVFKNAYDAYALNVRGDYYPSRDVLTIRDDGVGMSAEDFVSRWLTVGTESKVQGSSLRPIPRPANLPERRQMGEKGIGRLAIATLGPQLIVATRGKDEDGNSLDTMVVALIQWSMFEIPGLTLDQVAVPMRELRDGADTGPNLLRDLRSELLVAVEALGKAVPHEHRVRIRAELEQLDFDLTPFLTRNGPNVLESSGTTFVVRPVSPDVPAAMVVDEAKQDEFSVSDFQRFLLGFTNSISQRGKGPTFATKFLTHPSGGQPIDLIDPDTLFWDREDFALTDHTIEGDFDENGTFSGQLRIYGREAIEVEQVWPTGARRSAACGPFKIKFGYVQGKASESRLQASDFATMTARLEKIGGLYVYRDGIRVLPYGNSDADYLDIEKRRTLNAGRYYFSYRRMFGAIDLDSSRTRALQEKAGREGFRENAAYRDFRDILKNFLIQLAATYFSSTAEDSAPWRTRRANLAEETKQRAKDQGERDKFGRDLANAIRLIESGEYVTALDQIASAVVTDAQKVQQGSTIADVSSLEDAASSRLQLVRGELEVKRPAGLALTTELEREWESYVKLRGFAELSLQAASDSVGEALAHFSARESDSLSSQETLRARELRLRNLIDEMRSRQSVMVDAVNASSNSLALAIADSAQDELAQFDAEVSKLLSVHQTTTFADEVALSQRLEATAERHTAVLHALLSDASLERLRHGDSEILSLKERVLDLEEQLDQNLELLQLGQAVQIVSHEFESSIRAVRAGLKQLDPWARSTPRLAPVVRDLRASFSHLDGYLRLFTPLQRRLYREAALINGGEIENFLRGVFGDRFERHRIDFRVGNGFRDFSLEAYPSTFYPVFVNLVDNAVHWLSESDGPREIGLRIDNDSGSMVVSDTGPGVKSRDAEYIFERGFSRRRGGRGLGLSLARELLERDSWLLRLEPTQSGAEFWISPTGAQDADE